MPFCSQDFAPKGEMKWMIQKFQEDIPRLQMPQSFTSLLTGICWIKAIFISRSLIIEWSRASLCLTNVAAVKSTFLTSSALPKSHFRKLPGKNHRVFFEVCWSQWKRQFKSAENLSGGGLNLGKSFAFSCYFLRRCSTFSRVSDKDGKCLPHFGFINISSIPGDLFSSNSSSGWL